MPSYSAKPGSGSSSTFAWGVLALTAAVLIGLTIASGKAPAAQTGGWIALDGGRLGAYQWSVKAKSSADPCILVGIKRQFGPYSFQRSRNRRCAEDSARLAANAPPLIVSGAVTAAGSRPKLTAVGMIFPAAIRRVRIVHSDGTTATIPLDRLSSDQARGSSLGQFRYAAFSVRGPWCAERLIGQGASGRTLWDSGSDTASCEI
jgi:hypothetical protein